MTNGVGRVVSLYLYLEYNYFRVQSTTTVRSENAL